MGIGSCLSRFIEQGRGARFVEIELAVALVGGLCAPVLFLTFALAARLPGGPLRRVVLVGTLVGLEIPLLLRILQDQLQFKDLVCQVLTFDYLGALLASLLFPLVLVPKLGLVRTSLLFGLLNALVALWSTWLLAPVLGDPVRLRLKAVLACAGLTVGLGLGDRMTHVVRGAALQRTRWSTRSPRRTSASSSPGAGAASRSSSTATSSSPASTSTATTRRWCTRR